MPKVTMYLKNFHWAVLILYRLVSVGFGVQKKPGFNLSQGDVVTVNFDLKNAAQEIAAVTVTAATNPFQRQSGKPGAATAISARLMTRMPINGRNFSSLTDLSP